MIINTLSWYVPETIIPNSYFYEQAGLTEEEIVSKSGIKERRRAKADENTNTMGIEAVKKALPHLPFPIEEVDLIVGATYSPYDLGGTLAHAIQKEFNIDNAIALTIDSACSSFVNSLEAIEGYFAINKATKVLLVASEHNSAYSNDDDKNSGFLFGDGAAALFITKESLSSNDIEILDIHTTGLGNVGKSVDAVYVKPTRDGIAMPFGRDVFQYACKYITLETENILKNNDVLLNDLNYFIPHQANARITDFVAKKLKLDDSQVLSNIDRFGNTGCASTPIVLAQNLDKLKPNDTIVLSVFGGGYSSGAVLLRKL